MFKNYLKIAIRNLLKSKTSTFINILGLSIGLTCCFLINEYVQFELSYDKFQKNYNDIYKLRFSHKDKSSKWIYFNMVETTFDSYIKDNFPQCKNVTPVLQREQTVEYQEKQFKESEICYVDPCIFDMFTFTFIKGNSQNALCEPDNVVITEEVAKKYFENEDPIGKIITIRNKDLKVSAVIQDIPKNSNLKVGFIIYHDHKNSKTPNGYNISTSGDMYIQLHPNVSKTDFEQNLNKKIYERDGFDNSKIELQPLSRVHLYTINDYSLEEDGQGDIRTVIVYSLIAFFVLIIAIINFINISIGQLSSRFKEVGLRKVLGADKWQIIFRFFTEIMLICLISTSFAIILSAILLPEFNVLTNRDILNNFNSFTLLSFVGIFILTCTIAGFFPSFLSSKIQPSESLRGNIRTGKISKFTFILVVVQFILATFFFICSNLTTNQIDFMMEKNRVPVNEKIMEVNLRPLYRIYDDEEVKNKYDLFLKSINQNKMILATCEESGGCWGTTINNNGKEIDCTFNPMDERYFDMFGIKLKQGRSFNVESYPTDKENSIIVNDAFVKENFIQDPIGYIIKDEDSKKWWQIIGVVEDFNLSSIKDKVKPWIYSYNKSSSSMIYIKFKNEDLSKVMPLLQEKWKEFFPSTIMDYTFYDDSWRERYSKEINSQKLLIIVSIISVLLSIFGVFGMAIMSMAKRTKEIGIRKILGASIQRIILILLKDFIYIVVISSVIASFTAYYFMKEWLQDYVYRIDITIWAFLFPILIILAVVLFTVSFHTIKAAIKNPVDTLKYE